MQCFQIMFAIYNHETCTSDTGITLDHVDFGVSICRPLPRSVSEHVAHHARDCALFQYAACLKCVFKLFKLVFVLLVYC